jgi:PQQ-dependent catabolism-associated CXXCW motif protein
MSRLSGILSGVVLALALAAGAMAQEAPVAEPVGFWTGPLHGKTPPGLTGATVLDAAALAALIAQEQPVILDVAADDPRPPNLSPDAIWRPIHRSIPGAVWMPGAGNGDLGAGGQVTFAARVQALTGGARDRPIVTFCHRDCWASWNAAKRLVLAGYKRVYWFPQGAEGWQEAHETSVVTQDAVWASRPRP